MAVCLDKQMQHLAHRNKPITASNWSCRFLLRDFRRKLRRLQSSVIFTTSDRAVEMRKAMRYCHTTTRTVGLDYILVYHTRSHITPVCATWECEVKRIIIRQMRVLQQYPWYETPQAKASVLDHDNRCNASSVATTLIKGFAVSSIDCHYSLLFDHWALFQNLCWYFYRSGRVWSLDSGEPQYQPPLCGESSIVQPTHKASQTYLTCTWVAWHNFFAICQWTCLGVHLSRAVSLLQHNSLLQ